MENKIFFKIADHLLEVNFPMELNLNHYLPSFDSFQIKGSELELIGNAIIKVNISLSSVPSFAEELKVHAESSDTWGEGFRFEESDLYFITSLKNLSENTKLTVVSSKDFRESTIYLGDAVKEEYFLISWALMVVFGQGVLPFDTLMIHASAVERGQLEGYAFLGKSGTGKSTHSQLWLKYLNNFTLLNDDNPAIRIVGDNEVYIYGTPWSGKTSCYRNVRVLLKGIVRLRQAQFNKFYIKQNVDAFIQLLPSCSGIRWNRMLFNNMINTIEAILKCIPIGVLDCQVNKQAVEFSFYGIKTMNNV